MVKTENTVLHLWCFAWRITFDSFSPVYPSFTHIQRSAWYSGHSRSWPRGFRKVLVLVAHFSLVPMDLTFNNTSRQNKGAICICCEAPSCQRLTIFTIWHEVVFYFLEKLHATKIKIMQYNNTYRCWLCVYLQFNSLPLWIQKLYWDHLISMYASVYGYTCFKLYTEHDRISNMLILSQSNQIS